MDDPRIQAFIKEQQEKLKKKMDEGNFDFNAALNEAMEDAKDFYDAYQEEQDDEAYAHASKEDIMALDDDEMLVALSQKVYRITSELETDDEILDALNPVQRTFYVLDTMGDFCLDERFGEFLIEEPALIALVPEALNTIGASTYETFYRSFFQSQGLDLESFYVETGEEDQEDVYDRLYDQLSLSYFDNYFMQLNDQNAYHGLLSRYLRRHMDDMLEGVAD